MKNTKRTRTRTQGFSTKDCTPQHQIQQNPEHFFRNCTPTEKNLINHLLYWNRIMDGRLYMTQSWMAKVLGITREYVNILLGRLIELGIISSNYRHMRSCQYRISNFFKNLKIRERLSHIFTAFRPYLVPEFTQENIKIKYNKYNINLSRVIASKSIKCGHESGKTIEYHCKSLLNSISGAKTVPVLTPAVSILEKNNIPCKAGPAAGRRFSSDQLQQLCIFPDKVVLYVTKKLLEHHDLTDPFKWFLRACWNYCHCNAIRPYQDQNEKAGLPAEALAKAGDCQRRSTTGKPRETRHTSTNLYPKKRRTLIGNDRLPNRNFSGIIDGEMDRTPLNREDELRKQEEYRKTDSWKKIERLLGKEFRPIRYDD